MGYELGRSSAARRNGWKRVLGGLLSDRAAVAGWPKAPQARSSRATELDIGIQSRPAAQAAK